LTFWQGYRQDRVDRILELNKQIDLRRMPQEKRVGTAAETVVQQDFDLSWLYEPDFKAEVENWVSSGAT
jgi:hypothetical protein